MYRHYIDAERVSYNSPNPFIKELLHKKSFELERILEISYNSIQTGSKCLGRVLVSDV